MRGADVFVEMLIQHDVKHIFGVPGDTTMAFHDALSMRADEIEYIICRDERHAAYAADAYARVTGKVGVVDVPSGGGALYVVPGVSEANVSNIPLLCIASEISMSSDETNALTDCNQEDLFASVSKWNSKIKLTSKIPHLVRKGIRKSSSGITGATVLTVPENIYRDEYTGSEEDIYPSKGIVGQTSYRNDVTDEVLNRVLDLIKDAETPIVLAGGGVHLSGAYDDLEKFTELYDIPVVTSIDGKGSINEYSEYALGVIGANGGSGEANEVIEKADLVIVLGSKLDNVTTMGKKLINKSAAVIQVDIGDDVIGNNIKVTVPVMCDIKMFLKKLNSNWNNNGKRFTEWNKFVKAKVEDKYNRINEEYKRDSEFVVAARFFDVLDRLTDEETIFVGDAGTPTPYISSYVRLKKAGKYSIIPRGHGALGYALGASIGAKVGRPKSTVVSMFGDGSFGMSLGELETAKRLGLPIIFVNFQNNCYGWIKTIQRLYYKENYYGVDFSSIDAVKIAEGFGLKGRNISNNSEIEESIKWALEQDAPVMLNVLIEPPKDYVPPVYQWETDVVLAPEDRKKLVY